VWNDTYQLFSAAYLIIHHQFGVRIGFPCGVKKETGKLINYRKPACNRISQEL
jgi:hypothetical protein